MDTTALLQSKGGLDTGPPLLVGETGSRRGSDNRDHLLVDLEPPIIQFNRKDNVSNFYIH